MFARPPRSRLAGGSVSGQRDRRQRHDRQREPREHDEDPLPGGDLEHLRRRSPAPGSARARSPASATRTAAPRRRPRRGRGRPRGRSRSPRRRRVPAGTAGRPARRRSARARTAATCPRRRRRPIDQRAPAADPVAQRTCHELAEREADHAPRSASAAPRRRDASSERVISGRPGRYMSIESGPIATIEPRITISSGLEGNADVLDLRVGEQRLDALPAADPGALHAAERQLDAAAHAVAVDEDLPGADARRDAVGAAQVARPDARDEAVGRGVGERDRRRGRSRTRSRSAPGRRPPRRRAPSPA